MTTPAALPDWLELRVTAPHRVQWYCQRCRHWGGATLSQARATQRAWQHLQRMHPSVAPYVTSQEAR